MSSPDASEGRERLVADLRSLGFTVTAFAVEKQRSSIADGVEHIRRELERREPAIERLSAYPAGTGGHADCERVKAHCKQMRAVLARYPEAARV